MAGTVGRYGVEVEDAVEAGERRRSTRSPAWMAAVAVAVALWAGSPGRAEAQIIQGGRNQGFELRLFHPAVDSKGLFTVNSSPILPHLDISFGLILDYAYGLMRMDEPYDPSQSLVEHSIWGTLAFNLGLYNWAVLGVQLPIGVNFGRAFGPDAPDWGGQIDTGRLEEGWQSSMVGDVSLHAKFRFLRVARFPVGVGAVVQLGFMSGQSDGLLGDPGEWGLRSIWAQAVVDGEPSRRFRWAVNLGYRLVLADAPEVELPDGGTFQYDDLLTFGAGISLNLVLNRLDFVTEVYGASPVGTFFNWTNGGLPLEVAVGLKVFIERNSYLYLGAATGIMGPGYSASTARVFAAWIFEPSIGDRDGDGIKDDVDQCPDDPEDLDDFEDIDGCPDPDNDRDGIPDVDDECPLVPEDRDGIEDEDGCPEGDEGDRDGDGILDSVDQCPDDPEDIDQFEDEDGCPDPDNDGDGILDVDDLCPNDPEDIDQFEDQDGCPDPDNDQDRILDTDDQCPNEPEVYNGFEDEDGCPDEGRVSIQGSDIVIMDRVYFETDSAEIRPISFPILDAVAATLRGNPQITFVEIQGHADERSSDEYNIRLTQDRATSVLNYLVQRGSVERNRLRAVGYGERCPVDPSHTEAAWERNRRVEFKIIRTTAGPTGVEVACDAARELIPQD
jgi:outer membrane protein OmpA-like peptidoglycan-associated protein